jgi:hypothetical protein
MSALPGLVRRLLDEEAWREFDAPAPVGRVEHTSFRAFVEAKQPRGLGSRLGQLLALCGDDDELRGRVQRLYEEEIQPLAKHGGDRRSEDFQGSTATLKISPEAKDRGSDYRLARLKRDRPDLAERVMAGEVSVYAAVREAGIRKPTVTVTSPESIARSLRKHMSPDDVTALVRLLTDNT